MSLSEGAATLLTFIRRNADGKSFLLPPKRIAPVIRSGWHGTAAAIEELARAGLIVGIGHNVRGNVAWKLPTGKPVPCRKPPHERFVGRKNVSLADQARLLEANLRRMHGRHKFFMVPQAETSRRLRMGNIGFARLIAHLVDDGTLVMFAPRWRPFRGSLSPLLGWGNKVPAPPAPSLTNRWERAPSHVRQHT
jgi:hypothetical protein